MKAIHGIIAVAALTSVQPAQAGINDPEVIIYRVSGVVNDNNALATSFHCTNFSGVPEILRIVVRNGIATLFANIAVTIAHLNSIVVSTHDVFIYDDMILSTDAFLRGMGAIAATSVNITCTAMQVQTNVTNPHGIALHMTRFNPIPGTQE